MSVLRIIIAPLLLLSTYTLSTAQSWSFPDWSEFDSTFYVGSDLAGHVDTAVKYFTMDYSWGYFQWLKKWKESYNNPVSIGDSSHFEFVSRAQATGMNIVLGPESLTWLVSNARVIENYPGGNGWAQDTNGIRLPPLYLENEAGTNRLPLDERDVFFTLDVPVDTVAGVILIAGRPCYSIQAMNIADPNRRCCITPDS